VVAQSRRYVKFGCPAIGQIALLPPKWQRWVLGEDDPRQGKQEDSSKNSKISKLSTTDK
jgi:hypothetical protein